MKYRLPNVLRTVHQWGPIRGVLFLGGTNDLSHGDAGKILADLHQLRMINRVMLGTDVFIGVLTIPPSTTREADQFTRTTSADKCLTAEMVNEGLHEVVAR